MTLSIKDYLGQMLEKKSSDLHLTAGSPVQIRIDGDLVPISENLTAEETKALCYSCLNEEQIKSLETERELDLAIAYSEVARFRVNVFFHMGTVAGAFRQIPTVIPSPEQLNIPDVAMKLAEKPRGMVLVTGPTGSGKSTTLASMINHINHTRSDHIITIEDPVEYIHKSNKCLIAQREVGADTNSFAGALKRVLRQDPDVVLIGEMRDLETIGTAITVSETGHLVFATLHTNSTVQTINRIIDVFPPSQQPQVRTQLSFILEGIMTQTLVKKKGGGRVMAMEILIPNPAIRNLIREDKVHQIYAVMQMGQGHSGMQTMNQSLAGLYKKGLIEKEEALSASSEPEELKKLMGA